MLFNSFNFLFLFLPLTMAAFYLVGRASGRGARFVLAALSFLFYAYWDIRFLPLLMGSIVVNYVIGVMICRRRLEGAFDLAKLACTVGVVLNLALLAFFKYANFFVANTKAIFDSSLDMPHIVLPIGISFFTFTQIAFLIDAYGGKVSEYDFWDYSLFVSYFPHQIAGPILHHHEMMSQFKAIDRPVWSDANFRVGVSILAIGLVKKILLADPLADLADPVFAASESRGHIEFFEAWAATLAYSLQLYFDFSAYSDMAIGISLMFGIKLPINFDSPYKATSIIDFWQRWHMTLSRFLRDYLYIPLGGNRKGGPRRFANLLVTMTLGGLWHGASWNFVIWGALHGAYLVVNHGWRILRGSNTSPASALHRVVGWSLTFLAVMVAWVFFRAATFEGALHLLGVMSGSHGVAWPQALGSIVAGATVSTNWLGSFPAARGGLLLVTTMLVCLVLPNVQQLFRSEAPALLPSNWRAASTRLQWRASLAWAAVLAIGAGLALSRLGNDSQFLYFNF